MKTKLPSAHSPLGGSSAKQWMTCPPSAALSCGIAEGERESGYASVGTVAHELASSCLILGHEPWEYVGQYIHNEYPDIVVDQEMSIAVQVYVDHCREIADPETTPNWIEYAFHAKEIHELAYSTCDYAALADNTFFIRDYKHGVGIPVSVQNNPQMMYYAAGMLTVLDLWRSNALEWVNMGIVQPRAPHADGAIRTWTMSVSELKQWMELDLKPSMTLAAAYYNAPQEALRNTVPGEHCRFCPVGFAACPSRFDVERQLEEHMALALNKEGGVAALTGEQLGSFLTAFENAKIFAKKSGEIALARLSNGKPVQGWKLVNGQSRRYFKEGAEKAAREQFGDRAFEPSKMMSPAKVDKLPEGKKFTSRWAAKPPSPKTIAPEHDTRRAINPDTKSLFKPKKYK